MIAYSWLIGLLRHRRSRLLASIGGIAIAVGLLATVGAFLASSKATMTKRAVATVATDWQIEVERKADPKAVAAEVKAFPGLRHVTEVLRSESRGFALTNRGTTQSTGAGVVVGLPNAYRRFFPDAMRTLAGADAGEIGRAHV